VLASLLFVQSEATRRDPRQLLSDRAVRQQRRAGIEIAIAAIPDVNDLAPTRVRRPSVRGQPFVIGTRMLPAITDEADC
jgi:hypothetical protein